MVEITEVGTCPRNRKRSEFSKPRLKNIDSMKKWLIGELTRSVLVALVVAGVIVDNAECGSYRASAEKHDSFESFVEKEELKRPNRGLFLNVRFSLW